MSALIAAAHAKLNWLLDVVGVRLDGYHELDMLTQSLALADQLTFASADKLMLWVDGAPCDDEANLVLRAARLMQREARAPLGAAITLSKNIPVRAGLGGGSADCAATLLALNRLWGLNLHPDTLAQLGLSLGADVPFCLVGGLCRVRGMGELLSPLPPPPSPDILIVQMDGGLSTAEVFRAYGRLPGDHSELEAAAAALCRGDYGALNGCAANALARAAAQLSPAVATAGILLASRGAVYVRMTGSGSAVYGVFRSQTEAERASDALRGAYPDLTLTRSAATGISIS